MSFIKKENICIADTYVSNGEEKKSWKTIGEIVTMQGNDGPYQFIKLWGPGGFVEAKVFEPRDNNQQAPQQQGGYQQQPQQAPQYSQQQAAPQQQAPQGGYQNSTPDTGGWS